MYALIRREMLVGIFSTKEHMRIVIEQIIKDEKETNGTPVGNMSFRYIKFKPNCPWFEGAEDMEAGKALFSLATMHTERFPNKVETDWSTGEIIKL